MSEIDGALPLVVGAAVVLVTVAIAVIAVRRSRRSPRARAAADEAATQARESLRILDDAVDELDVSFEAADVLDAPDAPTELRRGRTAAHRARDRGFADVSALDDTTGVPTRRRDEARRVRHELETQLARIDQTHAALARWTAANRTPEGLIAAARGRRDDIVRTAGDPEPLLATLRERFDPADWIDAEASARTVATAIADADAALERASEEPAADHLRSATGALRRAARHARAVEDAHRIAFQAADNAGGELSAARAEIDDALSTATARPDACAPEAVERLRAAATDLDAAAVDAARRPREAIIAVARAREERDLALGDAVSPRVRLEAARGALPGTLACARAALAAADARDDTAPIADRLLLERARRELAAARAATDAGVALANARAAWHAIPAPRV